MIPVTKTFLPPIEEYRKHLDEIWESNWISNGGNLHKQLTKQIKEYLGVSNVVLTTNGTLPLQISLKLLGQGGEIVTTPFSYVATTSTIVWENCTPVFVDIHPENLTIDERKIEAAITNRTTAILATHVYGNPCNVEEIEKIALKYNLKVIYDGAHCFGVKYRGNSIFHYGDFSTCSFHATKLFHTGEGGALFAKNPDLYHKAFYSHNFGHNGEAEFFGLGINAKMSELQAGMGLSVLPYVKSLISKRKKVVEYYKQNLNFEIIQSITIREHTEWNFSFFPVIFNSEEELLSVQEALNRKQIFPRRYFYPSLESLEYVDSPPMPVSDKISKKILCLPLYADLNVKTLELISNIVNSTLHQSGSH